MKYFTIVCLVLLVAEVNGQAENKFYNAQANAQQEISDAIKKARAQRKHVLIQAGGNWCSWCVEFNRFIHYEREIDSLLKSDYIIYHLNYSPENKNLSILAKYKFPQRFGFPVFLILNENGVLIHTQNSSYLEQGRSYNKSKVIEFLKHWNRKALDGAN